MECAFLHFKLYKQCHTSTVVTLISRCWKPFSCRVLGVVKNIAIPVTSFRYGYKTDRTKVLLDWKSFDGPWQYTHTHTHTITYLKYTGVCGQPWPGEPGSTRLVRLTTGGLSGPKKKTHGRSYSFFHISGTELGRRESPVQVAGARLRTWVEDIWVSSSQSLYSRASS